MSSSQKQTAKRSTPPPSTQSSFAKLQSKLKSLQFYWFLCHFFVIFFGLLNFLTSFFGSFGAGKNLYFFKSCLNAVLLTYLIVLRQTYKSKPISFVFSQGLSLLRDDNVQYFLLALIYRINAKTTLRTISGCLYPFIIISFFHSINYFNNNLLNLVPMVTDTRKKSVSSLITNFMKQYNESSLIVASNFELFSITSFIIPLIKMIVFLRFIKPSYFIQNIQLVYLLLTVIVFNKFRYDQNKFTKLVISQYDMRFNQIVYNTPMIPPNLKTSLINARSNIIYYLSLIRIPTTQIQKKRS